MPSTPNVVVLTAGLSGSSVLTGLISRAGYWTGDSTHEKPDYDTYENVELIRINEQLMDEAGYAKVYSSQFDPEDIGATETALAGREVEDLARFVSRCDEHAPWIWKDPRLWLTIRVWKRVLDLSATRFIVLTREDGQGWVSTIKRRQICTPGFLRRYTNGIRDSIVDFLDRESQDYLELVFEDLLTRPEEAIGRINAFLGTELTLADFAAVYTKPIYRKSQGARDYLLAGLIYLKNFGERDR